MEKERNLGVQRKGAAMERVSRQVMKAEWKIKMECNVAARGEGKTVENSERSKHRR